MLSGGDSLVFSAFIDVRLLIGNNLDMRCAGIARRSSQACCWVLSKHQNLSPGCRNSESPICEYLLSISCVCLLPVTELGQSVCIRDVKEAFSVRPRFEGQFEYLVLDVEDNEEQNLIRLFPR